MQTNCTFNSTLAWWFPVFGIENPKECLFIQLFTSRLCTRDTNSTFLVSEGSIATSEFMLLHGRIEELRSALGTKNRSQSGAILKMLRIKIANQMLSNFVLVILRMWRTKPPPHDAERSPTLSIDIRRAKKVPSIPEGQSFELSTSIGIHLSLLVILAMLSTITTKK